MAKKKSVTKKAAARAGKAAVSAASQPKAVAGGAGLILAGLAAYWVYKKFGEIKEPLLDVKDAIEGGVEKAEAVSSAITDFPGHGEGFVAGAKCKTMGVWTKETADGLMFGPARPPKGGGDAFGGYDLAYKFGHALGEEIICEPKKLAGKIYKPVIDHFKGFETDPRKLEFWKPW